jgi:hypothetical protein
MVRIEVQAGELLGNRGLRHGLCRRHGDGRHVAAGEQLRGAAREDTRRRASNRFIHIRQFPGPKSKIVIRPNVDTLYSPAWLDLKAEPVVLSVPAMDRNRTPAISDRDELRFNDGGSLDLCIPGGVAGQAQGGQLAARG